MPAWCAVKIHRSGWRRSQLLCWELQVRRSGERRGIRVVCEGTRTKSYGVQRGSGQLTDRHVISGWHCWGQGNERQVLRLGGTAGRHGGVTDHMPMGYREAAWTYRVCIGVGCRHAEVPSQPGRALLGMAEKRHTLSAVHPSRQLTHKGVHSQAVGHTDLEGFANRNEHKQMVFPGQSTSNSSMSKIMVGFEWHSQLSSQVTAVLSSRMEQAA